MAPVHIRKVDKTTVGLLILALVAGLFYLLFFQKYAWRGGNTIYEFGDSASYINAWNTWRLGVMDKYRTPVYPAWLGLMQWLAGLQRFKLAAVIGQFILFLLSVPVFRQIAINLGMGDRVSFWVTSIYALSLGVNKYVFVIGTEGMALTCMVFFFRTLLRLLEKYNLGNTLLVAFWLLLLNLLRPGFIYLLPITTVLCLFCVFKKDGRKRAIALAVATLLAAGAVMGYMSSFKQQYGIFAASGTGLFNRFFLVREYGILDADAIDNDSLREFVVEDYRQNGLRFDYVPGRRSERDDVMGHFCIHVFRNYSFPVIKDAVDKSIGMHPWMYLQSAIDRLVLAGKRRLYFNSYSLPGVIIWLYLLLLVYSVCFIWNWIKQRRIPMRSLALLMMAAGVLAVAIIGAQDDWLRLVTPALGLYLLMLGQLWCHLKLHNIFG